MNTGVTAQRQRDSQQVLVRTKMGETLYRRMWGGIAWPTLKPGYACIVGEVMPDSERVGIGELRLLDEARGESIEQLFEQTVNLKDLYCVTRFYIDDSNEDLTNQFKRKNGLCRYRPPHNKNKEKFPYYKRNHITAFLHEAPQANNPEYGLRLIMDWLNCGTLKVAKNIKLFKGVLPLYTKENEKEKVTAKPPPEVDALRFVLAAFFKSPHRAGKPFTGFKNFEHRIKPNDQGGEYQEFYV